MSEDNLLFTRTQPQNFADKVIQETKRITNSRFDDNSSNFNYGSSDFYNFVDKAQPTLLDKCKKLMIFKQPSFGVKQKAISKN